MQGLPWGHTCSRGMPLGLRNHTVWPQTEHLTPGVVRFLPMAVSVPSPIIPPRPGSIGEAVKDSNLGPAD
jgi:hypothetical protein